MNTIKNFRAPAVPLVTVDPFFSIWSFSDNLYDDVTYHWCGKRIAMTGCLQIDGVWYRFMGKVQHNNERYFTEPEIIPQSSVEIKATETEYTFENDIARLKIRFRTPLLTDDFYLMTRPVSYISYSVEFTDNNSHDAKIYFDICSEICVDDGAERINFGLSDFSSFCGKGEKDVLSASGDDVRINWGTLHLVAPEAEYLAMTCKEKTEYFKWNRIPHGISGERCVNDGFPVLSAIFNYDSVKKADGFICVAYDDIYAIEYFGENLPPYWKTNGDSFEDVVKKAILEYNVIKEKCDKFDKEFKEKAQSISEKYCDIVTLAYRQAIAAHKLVKKDGKLLFLSKECFSNGCIGTVDVTYPSIPMFLLFCPELVEGMLNPIFDYVNGNHGWSYEFAPHDVGQYPLANGQVYGYETKIREMKYDMQMPVEECGNMILCVAALCKRKNDYSYAKLNEKCLTQWADYLVNVGYDPEFQLCTDDFAGHLAHNCNLSIKGILGIAAWGDILNKLGLNGDCYIDKAKKYALLWTENAKTDKNYSLTFDKKDTWSLKYNLVWNTLLNLNVFDNEIAKTEVEFYKTKINKYGIPLDCRSDYTKSDWQMWSVCLTDDEEYRNMIIDAMWDMLNSVIDRGPFSDWYYTSTPTVRGFYNRTVQGGLFLPLLVALKLNEKNNE